jgi:hypothetical protein
LAALVPPPRVHLARYQRLKRVFAIEIERCRRCGGKLKVIASLSDPSLVERILARVQRPAEDAHQPDLTDLHEAD